MYRASRQRLLLIAVLLVGVGFPSIAVAEEPPPQQLLQRTANMIGKERLQIGILSLDYGIVKYTYLPQKKEDGTGGSAQPIKHDLETRKIE